MKTTATLIPGVLGIALSAMILCSCVGTAFEPPQTGEIPEGPGVFTKNKDGAVLFDSNRDNTEKRTLDNTSSATIEDHDEFEAYKQWRQWKKSAVGSEAYQEFLEWRQWRKYREWKKSN